MADEGKKGKSNVDVTPEDVEPAPAQGISRTKTGTEKARQELNQLLDQCTRTAQKHGYKRASFADTEPRKGQNSATVTYINSLESPIDSGEIEWERAKKSLLRREYVVPEYLEGACLL
ncbi:hypothetical protein CC80DRAFT_561134 [Byssothecium circinans]|uniref:Uncharacterized protein n=1 Tax=Byssothecium circinans TaxID=147558 RepID=A0A6A5TYG2_9PLEO|nr:hypothetical protein CC80DRAFT_561134 [Byssothecium circinans]